jgi:Flp pilus assembly pilin Flp
MGVTRLLTRFAENKSAATSLEYALLAALIAVGLYTTLVLMGSQFQLPVAVIGAAVAP